MQEHKKFIKHRLFNLTVPSTKKEIEFRPFISREQTHLIAALEEKLPDGSPDEAAIRKAMGDIVYACTFGDIDIKKNPFHDVQWVFTQLRIKSVGEFSEIVCLCSNPECGKSYPFIFDLRMVKVEDYGGEDDKRIEMGDVTFLMKYPTVDVLLDMRLSNFNQDLVFQCIAKCIDRVITPEEVIINDESDEMLEMLIQNIEDVTPSQYEQFREFFRSVPAVSVDLDNLICPYCEHEDKIHIDGLYNFFL